MSRSRISGVSECEMFVSWSEIFSVSEGVFKSSEIAGPSKFEKFESLNRYIGFCY